MRHHIIPIIAFVLLCVLQATSLAAEDAVPTSVTSAEISTESLQAGKARVESAQDLSDTQRKPLLDLYDDSLRRLNDLADVRQQTASLEQTLANAPACSAAQANSTS